MTKRIGIIIILCTFNVFSLSAQNRYFSFGPVVSIDWYKVNLQNGFQSEVKQPSTISYGLEANYLTNRFLFSAKILSSERTFSNYGYRNDSTATVLTRKIQGTGHYFNLPISAAYRLTKSNRLEFFAGLGLAFEWLPSSLKITEFDVQGQIPPTPLPVADTQPTCIGGGLVHALGRYHPSPRLLFQLNPMYTHYPNVSSAYSAGSKNQFSIAFSINYKFQ